MSIIMRIINYYYPVGHSIIRLRKEINIWKKIVSYPDYNNIHTFLFLCPLE